MGIPYCTMQHNFPTWSSNVPMQNTDSIQELLYHARQLYSIPQMARELEVSPSTVSRWLSHKSMPKPYVADRLHNLIHDRSRSRSRPADFTFVDLFAGIGGLRLAFEYAGGRCVFSSELDSYCRKTYLSNFPDDEVRIDDIKEASACDVPEHDVLVAGFPCQPFSLAGVSKLNSLKRKHGFENETNGPLFFDVARIIEARRPSVVVLENVKNLRSHDKGKTFSVIVKTLHDELGYTVDDRIIDAQRWVPQHRERIVIVAIRDPVLFSLENIPMPEKGNITLESVLHRTDGNEPILEHDAGRYFDHRYNRVPEKYTLSDHLWRYLQSYAAKHRSLGNGFGFGLVNRDSIARTLSARYHKDGSEILVDQGPEKNPRRLTPREAARLMGFPDSFVIPVSDTRAYRQFGNAVVVPAFAHIARYVTSMFVQSRDEVEINGYSQP